MNNKFRRGLQQNMMHQNQMVQQAENNLEGQLLQDQEQQMNNLNQM